ncbi:MAG TPA: MBL fold metallo-hydrolase [Bryobacteraceae bacterium]|nr:MBL fold metallo-hydrolase [Bryobacteraceae bacterium]
MKRNMNVKNIVIVLTTAALFTAGTSGYFPAQKTALPTAADQPRKLTVTFFEMPKHGIAIAVQSPAGHIYLVDTGIAKDGHDTGRDIIAPFLRARKVAQIDGIVHTHPHEDHYGGTFYLLEHFKVKRVIDSGYERGVHQVAFLRDLPSSSDYPKLLKLVTARGVEHQVVSAGDKLKWDDALEVEVLSPPKGFMKQPKGVEYEINDNSVVLQVRHGRNVFLFTGDIGDLGQDYLLKTIGAGKLKSGVLAVPHHGFDSYERFAAVVKPVVVVASCLKDYPRDSIHSPGQRVKDVYGTVGSQVYVTAWHGSVQVTSDGKSYTVKTDRTPPL